MGTLWNDRPTCPGSEIQVGREKCLVFVPSSNLSNQSNQYSKLVENSRSLCRSLRAENSRCLKRSNMGLAKWSDRLDSLDQANNDGHFPRPTSYRKVGRGRAV